jgi:hypothetical protein
LKSKRRNENLNLKKKREKNKEKKEKDKTRLGPQYSIRPSNPKLTRAAHSPASVRARSADSAGPLLGLTVLTVLAECHHDAGATRQLGDSLSSVFSSLPTLPRSTAACAVIARGRWARPSHGRRVSRPTNSTSRPAGFPRPLRHLTTRQSTSPVAAVGDSHRRPR